MIYLNDSDVRRLGFRWPELLDTVRRVLALYGTDELAQPLKPYLRFREPANRIIAMPAFAGGDIEACGIKWIASYPGNLDRGLPRAHSAVVLNDPATGEPIALLRGALLSALRTAAVSGLMLAAYLAWRDGSGGGAGRPLRVGIVGFGPIGRTHLDMLVSQLGKRLESVRLYDVRGIDLSSVDERCRSRTRIASDWREVYDDADLFLTCTASPARYIDRPPLPGKLLLNVSLRDYMPDNVKHLRAIVVDDWTEVCREDTDIERLHLHHGLAEDRALTLRQVVFEEALARFAPEETVFFNPMGMAAFDIGVAAYYMRLARRSGIGKRLE